jgi:Tfp pilus assembly protein PilN
MRAVNHIPTDQQRGAGGAAGRSGGGAYILLGALALIVVMASAYVLAAKKVDDKKAEVASVTQQATAAEAKAQALTSYTKFAALRIKRVDTVTQLAASRFDWSHALREVARVLPANAWLTTMTGTTSPTVAGGGSGLRAALQVPAIEIAGCTTSQASVAKMMARMRLINGVQQVTLSSSDKGADTGSTTSAAAGEAGGASGDCRNGHSHFPMFNIVVFYDATSGVPATTSATTQTAAATTSSTTPSSSTPSSTAPATTASSTTPATTSTTAATGGTTP